MPAETHQEREPIDAPVVIELLRALLADADTAHDPAPETPLEVVGVDDDLAMFQLWDAVTEEFAERSLAEPDIHDLRSVQTIGELAEAIVRSLQRG